MTWYDLMILFGWGCKVSQTPFGFLTADSQMAQDTVEECSFETITEAFQGAINVAGLGRPVEECQDVWDLQWT